MQEAPSHLCFGQAPLTSDNSPTPCKHPEKAMQLGEAKDLGRLLQTGEKISAFSFKHKVSSFGARVTGSEAACCCCEPQPTAAEGQGSSGLQ